MFFGEVYFDSIFTQSAVLFINGHCVIIIVNYLPGLNPYNITLGGLRLHVIVALEEEFSMPRLTPILVLWGCSENAPMSYPGKGLGAASHEWIMINTRHRVILNFYSASLRGGSTNIIPMYLTKRDTMMPLKPPVLRIATAMYRCKNNQISNKCNF